MQAGSAAPEAALRALYHNILETTRKSEMNRNLRPSALRYK